MRSANFTKLLPRQRKYLEGLAQGMSKTEAKNYAQYAASTGSYHIENSSIKAAFSKLIRRTVPAHRIAKLISEGLEAKETKFFQKEGMVVETRDVINWSERREFAKLAVEFGEYSEAPDKAQAAEFGLRVTVEHIGRPENSRIIEGKQLESGNE